MEILKLKAQEYIINLCCWTINTLKPIMHNYKLESLAHRTLPDDAVKTKIDSLLESINHPDVFNIALTDSFGSGKSSILKTFFEKYNKEFDILPISLASFINQQNANTKKKRTELQEELNL